MYHARFINGVLTTENRLEIERASTALLSTSWIAFKSKRKRRKFLRISKNINLITGQSFRERKDFPALIKAVKEIELLDKNIIITFARNDLE